MAENSTIEWTHHTWSPWIGCQKVSPACDGCYAEHLMDTRMGRVEWGPHGERKRTSAPYWRQPLAWNRAAAAAGRAERVFPSLCDPFDNQVDPAWRRDFFGLIRATPSLLWLLLSKRPQNIVKMADAAGGLPANAALGATCEDQKRADINVPALLSAKRLLGCRVAFLSCEPLLGPIDLTVFPRAAGIVDRARPGFERVAQLWFNALTGEDGVVMRDGRVLNTDPGEVPSLDWVITGGETDQGKHKARPSHPDWFRQIRDACAAAGVPYLHKQNGEWAPVHELRAAEPGVAGRLWHNFDPDTAVCKVGKKAAGRLLDGVEHNGFPEARR